MAHKNQLRGKAKAKVQPRQKNSTRSKLDYTQRRQRLQQCYRCQGYGHRQSECLTKVSPSNDQNISTPVRQSNQKTPAMVAKSHEDDKEAFTCVNIERPRSSGNSNKSSLNGLTSNDEAIYSATCYAQSNDGQIYIRVGKLNGPPVRVLRDIGFTGTIVDRVLILDSMMIIPGNSVWLSIW